MGKIFISCYLLIALIFSPFIWVFGEFNHKSYFYNLGQSLVWPKIILSSSPKIDGSSIDSFEQSVIMVSKNHSSGDSKGQQLFLSTIGIYTLIEAAKINKNITMDEYRNADISKFIGTIKSNDVKNAVIKRLDGSRFGSITRKFKSAEDELIGLIKDRVKIELPKINANVEANQASGFADSSNKEGSKTEDARSRWNSIQREPNIFLAECRASEKKKAIELGGMDQTAADNHATSSCDSLLANYRECMAKAGAVPEVCLAYDGED